MVLATHILDWSVGPPIGDWWHPLNQEEGFHEFIERLRSEGGEERITRFWYFARLLKAAFDFPDYDCTQRAAFHFPPGATKSWSFKLERTRLLNIELRKYRNYTNYAKGAYITPSGPLSPTAKSALNQRPAGTGYVTLEEVRWVMDHGEDDAIKAKEVPNRGIPSLWRAYKSDPAKWLDKWAAKLLSLKDVEREVEREREELARDESVEAEDQARAIDRLDGIFRKYKHVEASSGSVLVSEGEG